MTSAGFQSLNPSSIHYEGIQKLPIWAATVQVNPWTITLEQIMKQINHRGRTLQKVHTKVTLAGIQSRMKSGTFSSLYLLLQYEQQFPTLIPALNHSVMSVLNIEDCLEKRRISVLSWPVQLWRTRVISIHPGPTHRRLTELTPAAAAMESLRSPAHNECHVCCFLLSISTSVHLSRGSERQSARLSES